jgi:hypothetical protein
MSVLREEFSIIGWPPMWSRRSRSFWSMLGAVVAVAACSSSTATDASVEMLWVGETADGSLASGTLEARVVFEQISDGIDIRIGDGVIETGEQWNAAAHSAAATALLMSGGPASGIRLQVEASDSIDGPSAGGLIGVAALADLWGVRIRGGSSMTGTISPNGAIGPVAGVPEKLRAAKAAGITIVVVPEANRTAFDPRDGTTVDVASFAAELGIEVVFVSSLLEAGAALIGPDGPLQTAPGWVVPEVAADIVAASAREVVAVRERLAALEVDEPVFSGQLWVADALRTLVQQRLDRASSSDDPLRNHAELMAAERDVLAWNASSTALRIAMEEGNSAAVERLRDLAGALIDQSTTALVEVSATPHDSVETWIALVDVAEFAADAFETAHAVLGVLDQQAVGLDQIARISTELADATYDVVHMVPLALSVARGVGQTPIGESTGDDVTRLVALLDAAVVANIELLDVTARGEGLSIDPAEAIAMVRTWGAIDEVLALVEKPSARGLIRTADAVSRYVESARLVELNHLVSSADPVLSVIGRRDEDALRTRIDVAHETTDSSLSHLSAAGANIDYFVWANRWAAALVRDDNRGDSTEQELLTVLKRLWFANVNERLLLSLIADGR